MIKIQGDENANGPVVIMILCTYASSYDLVCANMCEHFASVNIGIVARREDEVKVEEKKQATTRMTRRKFEKVIKLKLGLHNKYFG